MYLKVRGRNLLPSSCLWLFQVKDSEVLRRNKTEQNLGDRAPFFQIEGRYLDRFFRSRFLFRLVATVETLRGGRASIKVPEREAPGASIKAPGDIHADAFPWRISLVRVEAEPNQ